MNVSIVIVDFAKAEKVVANVKGILAQQGIDQREIIIWDNSENAENAKILQESLANIPEVTLIISEKNVGYAVANNECAKRAQYEILCFVNPDISWTESNTLEQLAQYMEENEKVGIIAPRQKEPNGEDALSIRKFPNFFIQIIRRTFLRNVAPFSSLIKRDEMQHVDRSQIQTVDWVQSSFLMIAKNWWETLGGFDERYFLFLADTQLCKDSWEKGKQVVYYPKTSVMSDGMRCSEGGVFDFFSSKTMQIHLKDSIRYFFQ